MVLAQPPHADLRAHQFIARDSRVTRAGKCCLARVFMRAAAGLAIALTGLGLWIAQTPAYAQASVSVNPLITPAELKTLIEKKAVVVLDIREIFQTDGKTPNYDAGHIPGALAAPYSEIRGPGKNPGQMISEEDFSEIVSELGITPDQHIVFAGTGGDATDFGGNARYYWTFKIAGFKKLSILDGGLGAWMALKYPLSTETPVVKNSNVKLKFDYSQVATHETIASAMGLTGNASNSASKKLRLWDTRPEEYFLGEDKHNEAARSGTLPGAKHFDQEEFFQLNTGKLLPKEKLLSIAKSENLLSDDETISFCNTGHWSATGWFILSEILGMKNVKVYPESIIGWSKTKLPMDNEPKRTKILWQELKDGVRNLKL